MIIFIHVIIAVASLAATGFSYLSPSKSKLTAAYYLVALTVISGAYLVVSMPAHLVQSCITGLAFIGTSFVGIFAARHKLAGSEVNRDI